MGFLLNKAATRAFILAEVRRQRPGWSCSRVSPEVLAEVEWRVRDTIRKAVAAVPSRGKTLSEIL